MANKITQIRYTGDIEVDNLQFDNGWSNNIIEGLDNVTQLGIYALPGTRFKINQKNSDTVQDLIINGFGIFSINLKDRAIKNLNLSENSYNKIKDGSHFIIIDLVYEGGLG